MSLANKMCRLCMGRSHLSYTVLQEQLLQKIAICVSLMINPDDPTLPLDVCALCALKVKDFYEFRKNCLEVQFLLEQNLSAAITEKASQPVEVKQEAPAPMTKFEVIVHNDEAFAEVGENNAQDDQSEVVQMEPIEQLDEETTEDANDSLQDEVVMDFVVSTVCDDEEVIESQPVSEQDDDTYQDDMIEYLSYEESIQQQSEDEENSSERPPEIAVQVKENPVEKRSPVIDTIRRTIHHSRAKGLRDEKEIYRSLLIECKTCGKSVERNRYEGHYNRHLDVRPYVCNVKPCESAFHCKIALRLHKDGCHSTQEHPCDQCGKIYPSRKTLYHHRKETHAEKQFRCDQCGSLFVSNARLNRHKVTHAEEREFQCPFCPKGFHRSNNLKVHLRSHTKEKPFACDICGKAFGYQRLLRGHIQRKHQS